MQHSRDLAYLWEFAYPPEDSQRCFAVPMELCDLLRTGLAPMELKHLPDVEHQLPFDGSHGKTARASD